jgi:excisionase family DNA binding protein
MSEARLLRIDEVEHRLGIGRTKVYDLVNRGELRAVHIDRSIRIPDTEVDALIARKLKEGDDA